MTGRVFVHVGSPKTGTTFLQDVLWSQRDEALAQGLLLPGLGFDDHFRATVDVCRTAHEHPVPAVFDGAWDVLVEEARTWDGTVLISHELFAGATAAQAAQALAALRGLEVHVVVTARDLVRQIPAEWQEHVKHRSTFTFSDFVRAVRERGEQAELFWRVQDPRGVLDRWGATLPADRVHLVTVPPDGTSGAVLWERFCGLVGLAADRFDLDRHRSNASLDVEAAELLRRVNVGLGDRIPWPGDDFVPFKEVFAHQVLADLRGTRLRLGAEAAAWAIEESRRTVDHLARTGVDVVGDLQELVAAVPVDQVPPPSPDDVDDSDLLAVSIEALADLLVRFAATDGRVRELEAARGAGRWSAIESARSRLRAQSERWRWSRSLRSACAARMRRARRRRSRTGSGRGTPGP